MDRGRESQGSTTACSNMSERDGKDQGEGSPKQACSYWFTRNSWLATVARTSILFGTWPMLYCVSLALSVSRFDFVIDFVIFSLLLPTYWFAVAEFRFFRVYMILMVCATTAAYLVSGWFLLVTTSWIFEISLCENSIKSIQSINQWIEPCHYW